MIKVVACGTQSLLSSDGSTDECHILLENPQGERLYVRTSPEDLQEFVAFSSWVADPPAAEDPPEGDDYALPPDDPKSIFSLPPEEDEDEDEQLSGGLLSGLGEI